MNDESPIDGPLDLSLLSANGDPDLFDARVGAIVRDAMAARHNRRQSEFARELAALWRPALVAAAIVVAITIPTIALTYRVQSAPVPPATDVLGIPRQLATILHSTRDPSLAELHSAVLGDAP